MKTVKTNKNQKDQKNKGVAFKSMSLYQKISYYLNYFNGNKFVVGLVLLIMNIGSKYAAIEFSKSQEAYFKSIFTRQVVIFTTAWLTTQDVITSILITAAFIILADFLVNPDSDLCIIPDKYKYLHKEIDINNDKKITKDEIDKATQILKKANEQNKQKAKQNYFDMFNKNKI